MATFQIHPEASFAREDGARVLSATLFAKDKKHDTRDAATCAKNPHTTRAFEFDKAEKKDAIHKVIQQAADEWAKSCEAAADRAKPLKGVL